MELKTITVIDVLSCYRDSDFIKTMQLSCNDYKEKANILLDSNSYLCSIVFALLQFFKENSRTEYLIFLSSKCQDSVEFEKLFDQYMNTKSRSMIVVGYSQLWFYIGSQIFNCCKVRFITKESSFIKTELKMFIDTVLTMHQWSKSNLTFASSRYLNPKEILEDSKMVKIIQQTKKKIPKKISDEKFSSTHGDLDLNSVISKTSHITGFLDHGRKQISFDQFGLKSNFEEFNISLMDANFIKHDDVELENIDYNNPFEFDESVDMQILINNILSDFIWHYSDIKEQKSFDFIKSLNNIVSRNINKALNEEIQQKYVDFFVSEIRDFLVKQEVISGKMIDYWRENKRNTVNEMVSSFQLS